MLRSPWNLWPTVQETPFSPLTVLPNTTSTPASVLLSWQASGSEAQRKQTGSDCENSAAGPSRCPPLISHKASFVYCRGSLLALSRPTRWRLPGLDSPTLLPPLPSITFSLCPHAASIETAVYILKGEHQEIDPQAPHWSVGKSNSLTVWDDETSQPWNAKHYFIYMVFSIKSKTLRMSIYFSSGWIVLGISGITCFILHAAGWTTLHKWLWLA